MPHVKPAIYVPGLNLQKPFSFRLKYRFSQVIKEGKRIKLFATQTCWLVPLPNCQIKYLPRVVYLLVFRTVYTGMFFVVVKDLVKLSPIPKNQQQLPFGNAQRNATCNSSGIIQAEVPPSFLDLPSPQVKSREQPTADMMRQIQRIAETLNHSLPLNLHLYCRHKVPCLRRNKQEGCRFTFLKVTASVLPYLLKLTKHLEILCTLVQL